MEQAKFDPRLDPGSCTHGHAEPMVMHCQDCDFTSRGMDMGAVYREAWAHQRETDHVILFRGTPQRFTPDLETRRHNEELVTAYVRNFMGR